MAPTQTRLRSLPHLRELDGVRGIAALLVFFHHICSASSQPEHWGPGVRWLQSFFLGGTVGVDIFFVLSGFLITSLLIGDCESPSYYRDFYWKRALRILPVYFACLLGILLFIPGSRGYVLLAALFIANFANVFHIEPAGPFWSLAVEEQFYLIWPTLVRRRSVHQLRNWAIGIIGTVILLRVIAAGFGHHNYHITPMLCDELAAGALLACGFERRQRENLKSSAHDPLFIAALVIGLLLFFLSNLPPISQQLAIAATINQTATMLLCVAAIGLIIAHTKNKLFGFLRSRVLTFFGLISYAFYMVHTYVMQVYDRMRPLTAGDTPAYATRLVVVLAITIVVCLLSRYLIELPAQSLRKRVLKPRLVETSEPAAARQNHTLIPHESPQAD